MPSKVEFPRINDNQIAYPHRYIYAVNPSPILQKQEIRPLYKIDTLKNEQVLWQAAGLQPGEPVFIAKPGSAEEDDGVVMTIVLDANDQKAFLLVLDAKTFKEIARLYAPHAIPVGLHAQFF
jgi:carotenoid cleavage dioxygenase-like enzyme